MFQTNVISGAKAVAITANSEAGPFSARLYVNCEAGQLGDATLVAKRFKSLRGATKWAEEKVA